MLLGVCEPPANSGDDVLDQTVDGVDQAKFKLPNEGPGNKSKAAEAKWRQWGKYGFWFMDPAADKQGVEWMVVCPQGERAQLPTHLSYPSKHLLESLVNLSCHFVMRRDARKVVQFLFRPIYKLKEDKSAPTFSC